MTKTETPSSAKEGRGGARHKQDIRRMESISENIATLSGQLDHAREERNALIVKLHGDGMSLREISKISGVTNPMVFQVVRKAGKLPS